MTAGRPTLYEPIMIEKAKEYIASCGREATELPTVEGLALHLGVSRDSVYEWQKTHSEFSDTIKGLLDKQKSQLMNDGLYGGKEVNSTMAIFLLKVNHGMIETSHTDITTKGQPIVSIKDYGTGTRDLSTTEAENSTGEE